MTGLDEWIIGSSIAVATFAFSSSGAWWLPPLWFVNGGIQVCTISPTGDHIIPYSCLCLLMK
jgi:hypothetical protein